MEQLVARRAHNPKVVWFESHSRYLRRSKGRLFLFCLVSIGMVSVVTSSAILAPSYNEKIIELYHPLLLFGVESSMKNIFREIRQIAF